MDDSGAQGRARTRLWVSGPMFLGAGILIGLQMASTGLYAIGFGVAGLLFIAAFIIALI